MSAQYGYEDPIVVDNIQATEAAEQLSALAEQGVDFIAVGASEIADPLPNLVEQYPDIFWYCNCGAGFPDTPGLLQSKDAPGHSSISAGFATGLKLQELGGDSVSFIGCCDLGFEKMAFGAYEVGLKLVDESYTVTYVPTGNFPFDFNNTGRSDRGVQQRCSRRGRRRVSVPWRGSSAACAARQRRRSHRDERWCSRCL